MCLANCLNFSEVEILFIYIFLKIHTVHSILFGLRVRLRSSDKYASTDLPIIDYESIFFVILIIHEQWGLKQGRTLDEFRFAKIPIINANFFLKQLNSYAFSTELLLEFLKIPLLSPKFLSVKFKNTHTKKNPSTFSISNWCCVTFPTRILQMKKKI